MWARTPVAIPDAWIYLCVHRRAHTLALSPSFPCQAQRDSYTAVLRTASLSREPNLQEGTWPKVDSLKNQDLFCIIQFEENPRTKHVGKYSGYFPFVGHHFNLSPFYESSYNYSFKLLLGRSLRRVGSWPRCLKSDIQDVLNFTCTVLKIQTQSGKKGTNKQVNSNKHTEEDLMDFSFKIRGISNVYIIIYRR